MNVEITSEIEWINGFEEGKWSSSNGQQKEIKDLPIPYMVNCVNKLRRLQHKLQNTGSTPTGEAYINKGLEIIDIKISEFEQYVIEADISEFTENQLEKLRLAFPKMLEGVENVR